MQFSIWPVSASAILFNCVAASPMTVEENSSLVLESRATPTTVTSEILTNMEFYVQYAAAAYCNSESSLVGSEVTCGSSACPLVEAATVTNYAYLGYDQAEVEGFLAIDSTNKLIVATYMGTQSLSNFIADLLVPLDSSDLCSGCKLHEGFQYAWQDVQSDTMTAIKAAVAAYPSYSVVATGHSLGGAVATIAGAYFRAAGIPTDIYTYGSPRVGNEAFVEFVDAQDGAHYRVTHTNDPIPRYPGKLLGFRHTSPEFWLSTGSATTTSYGISDIEVCEGTANTDCNDDSSNIILTSHSYYFQKVSACG